MTAIGESRPVAAAVISSFDCVQDGSPSLPHVRSTRVDCAHGKVCENPLPGGLKRVSSDAGAYCGLCTCHLEMPRAGGVGPGRL